MFDEEGEEGWVQSEIERELAGLAHLTAQDLEEEEEGDNSCHGNEEVYVSRGQDVTALFTGYLSTLQANQTQSTLLVTEAQQALDHAYQSITTVHTSNWSTLCEKENEEDDPLEAQDSNSSFSVNITAEKAGSKGKLCQEDTGHTQSPEVAWSGVESEVINSSDSKQNNTGGDWFKNDNFVMDVELLQEMELEEKQKHEALDAMIAKQEEIKRLHDAELMAQAEEELLHVQTSAATSLQARVRGWLARRHHTPLLQAARERKQAMLSWQLTLFQARARGYLVRTASQQLREEKEKFCNGVRSAQSCMRGYLVRREYGTKLRELRREREEKKWLNAMVVSLQAACRGYLVRQMRLSELLERRARFEADVVRMQACCRGYLTRKLYLPRIREKCKERKDHLKQARQLASNRTSPKAAKTPPSTGVTSPNKPKLTLLRRLQSALKALHPSSSQSSTPAAPKLTCDLSSSYPSLPSPSPPQKQRTSGEECGLKASSAPPLLHASRQDAGMAPSDSQHGTGEADMEVSGEEKEMQLLVAEEKALQEVVRSREEEMAVAQLARERMSTIFSADEIRLMAEQQRKRSTYRKELEHAATPLSTRALLGLVEDRLLHWRANYASKPLRKLFPCEKQVLDYPRSSPPKSRPLSRAQLLAASPKGTSLEEVEQVVLYGCRHPLQLASLAQCPQLKTASLVKCGLESLVGLQQSAPLLKELNVPSNQMKQLTLGSHDNLCFLDISDNHLASLHGLGHTPKLLQLTLTSNRVARVNGMTGCPQLQRLTLDSNLLINSKGLEDLSELQYLSCCENHLPVLEGLYNCHVLQHLLVAQNNLQQVPHLFNHVLLRELNLAENSLSDVTPITEGWLPLLQTLSLANNCISQLSSCACLIMLQSLDLTLNSVYDLPVLLQSLRGCYRLKRLAVSGNPVTQEKQFCSYLMKTLHSLEEVELEAGVNVDVARLRQGAGRGQTQDDLGSSNIFVTCLQQIEEQDELRDRQRQQLEVLVGGAAAAKDCAVEILRVREAHCQEYGRLLQRHLRQQVTLEAGRWEAKSQGQDCSTLPDAVKKEELKTQAAIVVQAVWRGVCGRRRAAILKEHRVQAATTIQAWFRGCSLRRRLRQVLAGGVCGGERQEDMQQQQEEEFNYEEEIVLDFLDERALEAGIEVLSPRSKVDRDRESADTPVAMYFSVPGAADVPVSCQQWRAAYHVHQSESTAPTLSHHRTEVGHSSVSEPSILQSRDSERQDWKHVPEAWGSEKEDSVPVSWDSGGQASASLERKGQENADEVSVASVESTPRREDAIRNEWGFTSDTTARLMWRRAQRQKLFHSSAARRKKLADPSVRLAQFKKKHLPSSQDSQPCPLHHSPSLSSQKSSKVVQSPSLEELAEKEHSLFRWTHNYKWVGHAAVPKLELSHQSHSSLLPHLEPHVLAGHCPRLVSSEAQNHIAGTKSSAHSDDSTLKFKRLA